MVEPDLMRKPQPFSHRVFLLIRILWFRFYMSIIFAIFKPFSKLPKRTLQLSYPHSTLPSPWSPNTIDVFYPPSYDGAKKHPLFIDIHGGGFAIGEPWQDSHFCRYIADATDCIVVSLPYRKTPFVKFPYQIYDLSSLVLNILSDPRLAIDTSKVAIGGFSAGGNLATAVSLLKEMQGKIQALVPVYAILDFSMTAEEKMSLRPPGKDVVVDMVEVFDYGYIESMQDKRDGRLSPLYANAKDLPENIYIVGAELDMLCCDTVNFAEKFGFHKKNLKMEIVKGMLHAFTHTAVMEKTKEDRERLETITKDLYGRIANWLVTTVWNTKEHADEVKTETVEEIGGEGVII